MPFLITGITRRLTRSALSRSRLPLRLADLNVLRNSGRLQGNKGQFPAPRGPAVDEISRERQRTRKKGGPSGLPPPEGPHGRRCPDHGKRVGTSGCFNRQRIASCALYQVTQSEEFHIRPDHHGYRQLPARSLRVEGGGDYRTWSPIRHVRVIPAFGRTYVSREAESGRGSVGGQGHSGGCWQLPEHG
jgi:hypothetical protein